MVELQHSKKTKKKKKGRKKKGKKKRFKKKKKKKKKKAQGSPKENKDCNTIWHGYDHKVLKPGERWRAYPGWSDGVKRRAGPQTGLRITLIYS